MLTVLVCLFASRAVSVRYSDDSLDGAQFESHDGGLAVEEEDPIEDTGGIEVKFLGRSGKFEIYSKAVGEGDKNKLTFEIDELREMDAEGNEVGAKANPKHQLKDFKKTEFEFTRTSDVLVGTAKAHKISFTSNITAVGYLKVDTYLIRTEGEVGVNLTDPDADVWDTFAGDVKFNIELSEWKWCGSDGTVCENKGINEVGEFIELDIELKSFTAPQEAPPKRGKGGKGEQNFELGGNISLDLTSALIVDGSMSWMPEGYPKTTTKKGKQIFTFKFPKFSDRATYDPILGTGTSASRDPEDTAGRSCFFGWSALLLLAVGSMA